MTQISRYLDIHKIPTNIFTSYQDSLCDFTKIYKVPTAITMSESGHYSDNDTSDEETDFSSEDEEEDGAEYSLGEYYDEDED